MDWTRFLTAFAGLALGTILRHTLPYLMEGLKVVGEKNSFKAWPAWQWKYMTSAITSLVQYALACLVGDWAQTLVSAGWFAAIAIGYAGGQINRDFVKRFLQRD